MDSATVVVSEEERRRRRRGGGGAGQSNAQVIKLPFNEGDFP